MNGISVLLTIHFCACDILNHPWHTGNERPMGSKVKDSDEKKYWNDMLDELGKINVRYFTQINH